MLKKLLRLKKEKEELLYIVESNFHVLDIFLDKNEKLYTKEESIKALKKIRDYLNDLKIKYKSLYDELEKLNKKIEEECKHEVVLKDGNTICMICGKDLYNDELKNTIYIIESDMCHYPYDFINTEFSLLKEKIDEGIENDNLLNCIHDEIKKIQYKNDNKVRRKTK